MRQTAISIILIIAAGFIVYINSLNGEFVWDDIGLIVDNPSIKGWNNTARIFTTDILKDTRIRFNYYRPLQLLTYIMDYSLWGFNVRGYHLTNILLHTGTALCIFWLVNILSTRKLIPLAAGIFFAVHPVHTEAVAYISGRADSMCALFMLLSFIFYIKTLYSDNIYSYLSSILLFMSAVLSRENSLILPVILLIYHWIFRKKIRIYYILPIFITAITYIIIRLTVLKSLIMHIQNPAPLVQRVPGFFAALATYIRLLFLPLHLHMEYGNDLFSPANPVVILGVGIFLALLFYSYKARDKNRLTSFSILWFLITLLPVSNLIFPLNAFMAEHWLYMPSIGIFLLMGQGLYYVYNTKQLKTYAIIFLVLISGFYSFTIIKQNNYWRDPVKFYIWTIRYNPNSSRLHNNLGVIYMNKGMYQDAITSFNKALEITPGYASVHYNLGNIYLHTGEYKKALSFYTKAVREDPLLARAYNNMGKVYITIGEEQKAIVSYKRALAIDPGLPEVYYNLGMAYAGINKNEEAVNMLKKSAELDPGNVNIFNNLGIIYSNMARYNDAISYYKKTIELDPGLMGPYFNLGIAYGLMGGTEESVTAYEKAVEIKPDNADAWFNLGIAYSNLGKQQKSIDAYKRSIELNPSNGAVYNNLAVEYFHKGDYDSAIIYCDKAVSLGFKVNSDFLKALEPYRRNK